jgi:3-oxoadipate enol-lactonase
VRSLGLEPPTLVGNGLGAFVALGALITDQELFGDVVLAGVGATFPEDARPAFGVMADKATSEGMAAVVDIAVLRIFTEDYLADHPDELAERRDVMLATPPAAFATACAALAVLDLRDRVPQLRNRTLIVTGSEDAATPPAMGEELDNLMPNSTYVELDGIAHGPQLQDPAGFLRTVRAFLEMGG